MYKLLIVNLIFWFFLTPLCAAFDLTEFTHEFSLDLELEEQWDQWLDPDQYMSMITPEGEVIMETGRRIYVGDEYLTADNQLYRVTGIEDNQAITELIDASVKIDQDFISIGQIRRALGLSTVEAQENDKSGIIGIYHTHNAESYIPTDGTDSIDGVGGIHAVGENFATTLEELGVSVNYSETLHLPHDRGAYRRSRNTVLELLAQNPDAIFDVHRDAAPKDAYATQIGDNWITQIQFVVGRQNQNLGINRQYAQSLKALADDVYPGLVKGIFYARGNYNQDLTPLNLLLEAGAHTNSRDAAKRGIALFAEVVDLYFYGPQDQRKESFDAKSNSSAITTTLWIILFTIATAGVFFVINAGGWQAALDKLKRK